MNYEDEDDYYGSFAYKASELTKMWALKIGRGIKLTMQLLLLMAFLFPVIYVAGKSLKWILKSLIQGILS